MGKKNKQRPSPQTLNLPLCGVETHAHLDLSPLLEEVDTVIDRARQAGVAHIGQVFLSPAAYNTHAPLFASHPTVFFLLGIHPHDAQTLRQETLTAIATACTADKRIKAIGEIGLDYYRDHAPRAIQHEALQKQLALALELDLPVAIHSREAEQDTIAILQEMGFAGRPILWHCFGRDTRLARILLNNDWHIAVPGPVTYKKNTHLQEAVSFIPLEKIMLETDCPYLAPEPWRGTPNEPALLAFTAEKVAALKQCSPEHIWRITGETARRFFSLDPASCVTCSCTTPAQTV